ncbi:MAG TPA: pyridoxal 5'-phosphate synthase lyase subunit PdxS [Patescibacteria group bacterium]|nr:pyridoxal 5'-phosphate synthase lyase subunit PdxS [Patescibacteria group bacterium]
MATQGTFKIKSGLAQMLKGGVIMDVVNAGQAKIAEEAGAVAVMALERVPSDIRAAGGVARMADPSKIKEIQKAVTIPVMAKCRIGHFVEAQVLEALKVDFIDESEVLTPADEQFHIEKTKFNIPFVCGARDLGEALRRINEGAAMVRTKGEAGTGNIVEAVKHIRAVNAGIIQIVEMLKKKQTKRLKDKALEYRVPAELILEVAKLGRLPVVNFAAGGIATPADAALCMQLGVDGVFVGSGIFKSNQPQKMARAIVDAVAHFKDAEKIAKASENLGEAMKGLEMATLETKLASRGI